MADPADPWSFDYFNPETPHVEAPAPKTHTPKILPDEDRLFMVQRHALQILKHIENLKRQIGHEAVHKAHHEFDLLDQVAENNYRVINSYLRKNSESGQSSF